MKVAVVLLGLILSTPAATKEGKKVVWPEKGRVSIQGCELLDEFIKRRVANFNHKMSLKGAMAKLNTRVCVHGALHLRVEYLHRFVKTVGEVYYILSVVRQDAETAQIQIEEVDVKTPPPPVKQPKSFVH